MEQTWLTLDQTCTTLRLPKETVINFCKDGFLPCIWGRGKTTNRITGMRILDPTPGYKEKLRLAAIVLHKNYPETDAIHEKALLTRRELDLIVGWTFEAGSLFLRRHNFRGIPLKKNFVLYTAQQVRQILWRKSGRKLADGRSPVLLTELIEWFRQYDSERRELTHTDEQIKADELLQKRLAFVYEMSDKDRMAAESDFKRKADLARRIVQILDSHDRCPAA